MQEGVYKKPGSSDQAILDMHLMMFKLMRNEDLYKNRFDIKFKLLVFRSLIRLLRDVELDTADQQLLSEVQNELAKYEEYYRERSSTLIRLGGGDGR